jgi:formylglycine-generating enzyme required for sulfatase activity
MTEKRFALLIANWEFPKADHLSGLIGPEQDLVDLKRLLDSPDIGGFQKVETISNGTKDAIQLKISEFIAGKDANDLMLIYYSGHGVQNRYNKLYLAAFDTATAYLSATAIRAEFIVDEVKEHNSRRVVIILDCCFSGAAEGTIFKGVSDLGLEGYGCVFLTSSNSYQKSIDAGKVISGIPHSLFTHFLIDGLETGLGGSSKKWITVDDLYTYASQQVKKIPKPQRLEQDPQKFGTQEGQPLIIARNPAPIHLQLPTNVMKLLEPENEVEVRLLGIKLLSEFVRKKDRDYTESASEKIIELTTDGDPKVAYTARKALKSPGDFFRTFTHWMVNRRGLVIMGLFIIFLTYLGFVYAQKPFFTFAVDKLPQQVSTATKQIRSSTRTPDFAHTQEMGNIETLSAGSARSLTPIALEVSTDTPIKTPTGTPDMGYIKTLVSDVTNSPSQVSNEYDMVSIIGGTVSYPDDITQKLAIKNVNDFLINKNEVSYQEFQQFVRDSGYKTEAEKAGFGTVWSSTGKGNANTALEYSIMQWTLVNGASWLNPQGSDNSDQLVETRPISQVSWNDAKAYCEWKKERLVTVAEWHIAENTINHASPFFLNTDKYGCYDKYRFGEWVSDGGSGNSKLVVGQVMNCSYSLYPSLWVQSRSSDHITFRCAADAK